MWPQNTAYTHSLEVAQIAKSIAIRINSVFAGFKREKIDTDLVETAALAHDLGHPPFGHNGEEALDECMRDAGGFEGNAQTLRILATLEKRATKSYSEDVPVLATSQGRDNRIGLNLSYRTLASVLKYDVEIPRQGKDREEKGKVVKGYYYTEGDLVEEIKQHVGRPLAGRAFKTVECCIMDVADDIAYSTYDLEDSFKARFLTPLSMLASPETLISSVAKTVSERLDKYYADLPVSQRAFSVGDVYKTLFATFGPIYGNSAEVFSKVADGSLDPLGAAAQIASGVATSSDKISATGYYRTKLTSELVGSFIRGVQVEFNHSRPALSRVRLDVETFKRVEVLKNFAYQALIMSSMLKVAEHRGKDIVKKIFDALDKDHGHLLMPDDFREMYHLLRDPHEKRRVICDFIAGMTDRYAIQFYSRLFGINPESIYSPL